jgi:hypothetical protein
MILNKKSFTKYCLMKQRFGGRSRAYIGTRVLRHFFSFLQDSESEFDFDTREKGEIFGT